jgi:hypothetical protein
VGNNQALNTYDQTAFAVPNGIMALHFQDFRTRVEIWVTKVSVPINIIIVVCEEDRPYQTSSPHNNHHEQRMATKNHESSPSHLHPVGRKR